MEKITVETTGEFMLVDPETGTEIESGKKVKVAKTDFILRQIEQGQLRTSDHVEGRGTPDEGPSRDSGGALLGDSMTSPAPAEGARKGKAK